MKTKINMVGGGFQHDVCSSAGAIPKYVDWVKDKSSNISIHIDWDIFNISPEDKGKVKYAWLAESSAIIRVLIDKVKDNLDFVNENYELIFTHDKRLLSLSDKMRFVLPNAVPWVQDRKVFRKIKLVSMIASAKNMTPGHVYRLQWLQKLHEKIDVYGNGHNPIPHKEMGLKLYNFSFAMENDNYPSIFCEKITDCFAMGTIPIFWGTPDIGEYFNENGIIMLTDDFDINSLSVDLYQSKLEYVKENYERSIELPTAEDYIYLNYLK
jgi:hypothetical protein